MQLNKLRLSGANRPAGGHRESQGKTWTNPQARPGLVSDLFPWTHGPEGLVSAGPQTLKVQDLSVLPGCRGHPLKNRLRVTIPESEGLFGYSQHRGWDWQVQAKGRQM